MQRSVVLVALAVALFGALGADAREATRERAVLGSDLESWQHLSMERMMTLGIWKDITCPFREIPNYDYVKGFAEYCKTFGKVYSAITYPLRFALWKASQNCVYARNAEAAKSRFFMRVNAMHDMTEDEFKKTLGLREMTGANAPRFRAKNVLSAEDSLERSVVESLRAGSGSAVADPYSGKSLDWRSKGVFAPIAFQGQCGNCWAWTSATLVEAAWKIAGNPFTKVSVQEITWCSNPQHCHGCFGGVPGEALKSLKAAGGVCSDAAYPIDEMSGDCKANCPKVVQISEVRTVYKPTNENDLFAMLSAGPVGVGVVGQNTGFLSYGGGVFDEVLCQHPDVKIDHAVVLVGYGTDPAAGDYWILRNSWGEQWGEQGYMRMRRGVNQCKITTQWAQAIATKAGASPAPPAPTPTPAPPSAPVLAACKTKPDAAGAVRTGVCQDMNSCLDGKGTPVRGLCAGASNIQCCLGAAPAAPVNPTPAPAVPVPAGPACLARHPTTDTIVSGSCIDAAACKSTSNVPVRGACHGTPANVQCCLPKSP